ncbi:MAG: ABC transporter permease [Bacteroidetes bacterium]|nr:ABC transporter permease [Bacteroidota bacterium]
MNLANFVTLRYLRSKKDSQLLSVIAGITITGIALGVAVLILALTILDGFEVTVKEKIINFRSHIIIDGFSGKTLKDDLRVEQIIQNSLGNSFSSISKFISKSAIIRSNSISEGVSITGIDQENDNSEFHKLLIQGEFNFTKNDRSCMIIGKKLAEILNVNLDDKLTVFAMLKDSPPSYENPPAIKQFIVSGIYESGMVEYDDLNVYISFADAQKLLNINNDISGYNIRLNSIAEIENHAEKLQENLGYPYYVRSVFKQHQNIFTWLELQKKPIPIILGLIILVAVLNVIGTILMLVLEKTSAIGILKSLGAGRKLVVKIFLLQGLYLSLIGVIAGNIIALILSLLQINFNIISLPGSVYFLSSVPISINPLFYFVVSATALLLSMVSALIPSLIASKIQPVKAIRFN